MKTYNIYQVKQEVNAALKANKNLKQLAFDDEEKTYYNGAIDAYSHIIHLLDNLKKDE